MEGIWDYTAGRWGVAQADRYVLSLRQACVALARNEIPG
jgi:toxin ParE1/3/4